MASAVASTIVVATTIATTATAIAAASAATLASDDVDECLNLLLGGIVHREHLAFEGEAHACVGVVEVDGHGLVLHLYYEAIHALAIGIHEGDDVAGIDLLVVKLAVHAEDLLVYVKHEVFAAVAVGFLLGEGKVEGVALLQVLELLLESLEGEAQTCGKLEGLLGGSLLYELALAFKLGIHVVRYDNRLAGIDFCHNTVLYIIYVCATKVLYFFCLVKFCTTFAT